MKRGDGKRFDIGLSMHNGYMEVFSEFNTRGFMETFIETFPEYK